MGASRTFSIRSNSRRTDETHFMLSHGDLVSMNGMFQKLFQHRCFDNFTFIWNQMNLINYSAFPVLVIHADRESI